VTQVANVFVVARAEMRSIRQRPHYWVFAVPEGLRFDPLWL